MILLGEQEELNCRLMQRSFLECMAATPVAGLQTYLRSSHQLTEAVGPTYISPFGGKTAPLRNMRLARTISTVGLLRDSKFTIYRIVPSNYRNGNGNQLVVRWRLLLWIIFTWCFAGAVMVILVLVPNSSWIGIANCIVSCSWAIIVRIVEWLTIETSPTNPTRPERQDAVIFLGRRNSGLVIEGTREDVCRWTGAGLRLLHPQTEYFTRLGSFAVVLFTFITMPNGTMVDQLSFVLLNVLAQANVRVGQHLNAADCLSGLELVRSEHVPTRTHVYGHLIRYFGDGNWIDIASLLPKSEAWSRWRSILIGDLGVDPKKLYEKCIEAEEERSIVETVNQNFDIKA